MVSLLHKLMGASQGEIHVSFLVQSSPFAPWVSDIVLESLTFSVICINFTLRNIPCYVLVMLETSLKEACTGYEGAYTELRVLLNTLTYSTVHPISLLHKLLFACRLNEVFAVHRSSSECCVCVEKEEARLNLLSVIDLIIFALPIFGKSHRYSPLIVLEPT